MTAKRKAIKIERGADFYEEFDLSDNLDLTDIRVAMQFRSDYGYPALLTLTTQNGGLSVDAQRRKLIAVFAADVASAFLPGRYVYDNKSREISGRTTRLYEGEAVAADEVTDFDFGESGLLLETGGHLLLETGGQLLLEM